MDTKQIFEAAIARREKQIRDKAFKFNDESQAEFNAKVAHRIKIVCLGIGDAREIPDINQICPGLSAIWEGFKIERRRVDYLDNVYVSRA